MLCQKTTYGPCRLLASLNSAWLHQKRSCRGIWNFDQHKDFDILSCHGIHYDSGQLLLSPIFWGGKTHRLIERMYVHGKTHRHTANNGWLLGWPGCHSKRQGSSRILGSVIGITLSSHREMWTVLIISISTFVAFRDHVSRKIIQVVSDNISTVDYLPTYEQNKSWIKSDRNCNMDRGYTSSRIHYLLSHSRITASNHISLICLNDKYEWQPYPELLNFLNTMCHTEVSILGFIIQDPQV